jgi:ParB-like chromosome segregation protein Spo0J
LNDPIQSVQWLEACTLNANDYNPNAVHSPEMALLELSLLMTGWVQPILVRQADMEIIDGFHRWRLAQESKELLERYAARLPCCVLDLTRPQAMLLTIRMNRAKGTHVAFRMSAVVRELIDKHSVPREQIMAEIGATAEEVQLLYQEDVFKQRGIKDYKYSKAWVPEERNGGAA